MLKAYSTVFWHLISNSQRLSRQIQVGNLLSVWFQSDSRRHNYYCMNLQPQTTRFKWMVGDFQPFFMYCNLETSNWNNCFSKWVAIRFQECSHFNILSFFLYEIIVTSLRLKEVKRQTQGFLQGACWIHILQAILMGVVWGSHLYICIYIQYVCLYIYIYMLFVRCIFSGTGTGWWLDTWATDVQFQRVCMKPLRKLCPMST